jgi:hypothetical protein
MTRWYPVVPIGGEMGVNCAVLSYDGTIFFGLHAATSAVPDVERIEEFLQASFSELCELTLGTPGKNKTKQKARRRKPRAPAKKAEVRAKAPVRVPPPPFVEEATSGALEKPKEAAKAVVA